MGYLFKQRYTKPGLRPGKRVTLKSKKWYIAYRDANGALKREPAFTDKKASQELLLQKEQASERGMVGLFEHGKSPISSHIADYEKYLENEQRSPGYIKQAKARVSWICETGGITRTVEISISRVSHALGLIMASKEKGGLDLGPATRNGYLTAMRAFVNWLLADRRATSSPIEFMDNLPTKGRERRKRRPLNDEQFAWLLEITEKQPITRRKVRPLDRVALYLLAAFTGYRRNELSTITPDSFIGIDGPDPRVTVPAEASKRKDPERNPIPLEVAQFFKGYLAGRPSGEPIWDIKDYKTAKMLRQDMDAAGLDHTFGKERVDFHSLRQKFITGLALADVAPKLAQQLARHSTINLTMNTYAIVEDAHERAAIEKLKMPDFLTRRLTAGRREAKKSQETPRQTGRAKTSGGKGGAGRSKAGKTRKKTTKHRILRRSKK